MLTNLDALFCKNYLNFIYFIENYVTINKSIVNTYNCDKLIKMIKRYRIIKLLSDKFNLIFIFFNLS